jgi:hypothetical protein
MNQQQNNLNANTTAQQQPPQTIIKQPAQQQPPVIVQQPAPAQQAPVIINGQPAPQTAGGGTAPAGNLNVPDDSGIQTAVDKKLNDDPALSSLGITATVVNGKVTLIGSVHSEREKAQVERTVRAVKGVKSVDNKIIVSD